MIVELSLFDLKNLLAQAAELGVAAYQKTLEPTSDYISQRDVRKWLKRIGQNPDILNKMLNEGFVHPQRTGPAINSKIVYSKLELLTALSAINMQHALIKKY